MSTAWKATDTDLRCWQARNLKALAELVRLGEERKLSPLEWTLPTVGTVTGRVAFDADDPRAVFDAWSAELAAHPHIAEHGLGLHEDGPARRETRLDDIGNTRLTAAFTYRPPQQTRTVLCLTASWYDHESRVTEESQSDTGQDTIEAKA